ncbi:class V chitinase [Penicillium canescens]|nr:class V chitinase [Penicillium canescens]
MQQKIQAANNLCLGGVMIWSMDMDNTNRDAMNDLLGIGQANGVTEAKATDYKNQLGNATLQNSIAASCYWTLCGGTCNSTYFDVTEARGQIAHVQQNSNSNSYGVDENGLTSDLTCTGGFQAYCCTGFVPSSKTNTGNMFLYGQGVFSKRNLPEGVDHALQVLDPRGTGGTIGKVVTASICAAAIVALIAEAPFTFGLSLIGIPIDIALCAAAGIAVTASGFVSKPSRPAQSPPKGQPKPKKPKIGTGNKPAKTQIAGWPILSYTKDKNCDCSVTYTCRYGMGWDEVCDNQRWAITKKLNGQTVFHPGANRPYSRMYRWWAANQRSPEYRTLVQGGRTQPSDANAQCQLDEFPMGDLVESGNDNPQACRLVNGLANGLSNSPNHLRLEFQVL